MRALDSLRVLAVHGREVVEPPGFSGQTCVAECCELAQENGEDIIIDSAIANVTDLMRSQNRC